MEIIKTTSPVFLRMTMDDLQAASREIWDQLVTSTPTPRLRSLSLAIGFIIKDEEERIQHGGC